MSNHFHTAASRKGIAVAIETEDPLSSELVENDAPSSIRWKVEPPPPQIGVACSLTNRQEQLPILKAVKPKDDDGNQETILTILNR